MEVASKHPNGYSPGDAFKEVDILPPLVEEAASSTTELWLVQLPVNEVSFCFLLLSCLFFHLVVPDDGCGLFSFTPLIERRGVPWENIVNQ